MPSQSSKPQRCLAALWFPSFATDRHERLEPALAGVPFATYTEAHNALLLTGVNHAASHEGLTPGMTLANARALVPDLALREAAPEADFTLLKKLRDWCLRYTPLTAIDPYAGPLGGLSEDAMLLLDITGCAHLFGGEAAIAEDMVGRLDALGFSVRLGLADTPLAATAFARFGGMPITYQEGRLRDALRDYPLQALRLSAKVVEDMRRVGLKTFGDVFPLSRASLAARYGFDFAQRLDRALGDLEDPISPTPFAPPYRVRLSFPDPIGAAEDIAQAVSRLITRLTKRLERDCKGCRKLVLHCFRADGDVQRLTVGAARAARDPKHLGRLFSERLFHLDPGFDIDAMVLAAEQLEALHPAQEEPQIAAKSEGLKTQDTALVYLADRLAAKLGENQVLSFVSSESHIPERANSPSPFHNRAHQQEKPSNRKPLKTPERPSLLIHPPEPIKALEMHGFAPPPALPTTLPTIFQWRGKRCHIRAMEGPERIAPEWWRTQKETSLKTPPAEARRDYYKIEDQEGNRFWLYHEERRIKKKSSSMSPYDHGWLMHGVFL